MNFDEKDINDLYNEIERLGFELCEANKRITDLAEKVELLESTVSTKTVSEIPETDQVSKVYEELKRNGFIKTRSIKALLELKHYQQVYRIMQKVTESYDNVIITKSISNRRILKLIGE